jgi:diguanylate cyclase (GGDEF)-like protein/PAS domain S-box-containing protein
MTDFLQSDAVWARVISNVKDYAIFLLDPDGNVAVWNDGASTLNGYTKAEAIGMHFSCFYTEEARAIGHPERELAVAISSGKYEEEEWLVRKDMSRFWAHVIIVPIYDENKLLCGFGKVVRDFTTYKQAIEQSNGIMKLLEHTARTDYLTGLDNRRSFDKTLADTISGARRHDRPLSLAMIDLDCFKAYNDKFGHLSGDGYLRRAATAWRQVSRPEDFIARYGGEEFVVILPDTARDGATACLERLRNETPEPLTCSVGLAEWDGTETPNELIGRADHAVYQAKASGRNRVVVADITGSAPEIFKSAQIRLETVNGALTQQSGNGEG